MTKLFYLLDQVHLVQSVNAAVPSLRLFLFAVYQRAYNLKAVSKENGSSLRIRNCELRIVPSIHRDHPNSMLLDKIFKPTNDDSRSNRFYGSVSATIDLSGTNIILLAETLPHLNPHPKPKLINKKEKSCFDILLFSLSFFPKAGHIQPAEVHNQLLMTTKSVYLLHWGSKII